MTADRLKLFEAFEDRSIIPAEFKHSQHVQVAWETLRKYAFLEATVKYSTTINAIATKAGAPEKFKLTITIAFLSLIAERMQHSDARDYDEFIHSNQDLLNKSVLEKWYSRERLESESARMLFLIPDKLA